MTIVRKGLMTLIREKHLNISSCKNAAQSHEYLIKDKTMDLNISYCREDIGGGTFLIIIPEK